MNQQIKQLWVNALRSGEYKQATGRLRRDDNYCCLGVLCDVHSKMTGEGSWIYQTEIEAYVYAYKPVAPDRNNTSNSGVTSKSFLPKPVEQWADFRKDTQLGEFKLDLVYYNDLRHFTFAEIADLIEKEA